MATRWQELCSAHTARWEVEVRRGLPEERFQRLPWYGLGQASPPFELFPFLKLVLFCCIPALSLSVRKRTY